MSLYREPWMRWYDLPGLRRIGLARWVLLGKHWHPQQRRLAPLRALYWVLLRGYETEICSRHGGPVGLVFHVPDALWEQHAGFGDDARRPNGEAAPGVLCIRCFNDLYDGPSFLEWTCQVAA